MKPSEALIAGKEWLETHKWGRFYDYHPTDKTYCAVGALYAGATGNENAIVEFGHPDRPTILEAENYLDIVVKKDITTFNDDHAKRKRDVVSVYNKAIKLAQKEEN